MRTLIDLFETFGGRGDQTAFVNRTGVRCFRYSYGEIADLSLRMARLLADNSVGPGDRVLLWAPNSSLWGVAFWGIMARGAIAVPVDFMSDRERAETICALTEAKLVLPRGAHWPRRGNVTVTFGEPLRFRSEEPEEIVARARRAVEVL